WMRLKRGASVEELAEYLTGAETVHMGMSQTSDRIRQIAEKAVAIGA
ncbi:MAG: hypothetical protein JWQ97_3095, partial [Phenylobacterium sp.]|nr:hypothetical protein [Phenylobacterium sp.]